MKDTYTIKRAYPWTTNIPCEIEIKSDKLIYSELGHTHSGCQSNSMKNNDKIHKLCIKVSELIAEIDKLNNE